jgi:antitoxin (DNA-binding transcriptional repressor) of toxin-antitoxin stability system
MINVPIKELKENLSDWAEKASNGAVIQITKYNRPYILLTSGQPLGLVRGSMVGRQSLAPVLRKGTQGRALKYLMEDRE